MKDECINCGAWKGLHHYETNQCPRNGQEASIGKTQEWESTVYQEDITADLRAELARLTAGSEAMQEDARKNTATIKAQAEEIRTLKEHLEAIEIITALGDYEMSYKTFKAIRAHTLSVGES